MLKAFQYSGNQVHMTFKMRLGINYLHAGYLVDTYFFSFSLIFLKIDFFSKISFRNIDRVSKMFECNSDFVGSDMKPNILKIFSRRQMSPLAGQEVLWYLRRFGYTQ